MKGVLARLSSGLVEVYGEACGKDQKGESNKTGGNKGSVENSGTVGNPPLL